MRDIGLLLYQAEQYGRNITFHIILATVEPHTTKHLTEQLETKLRFTASSALSLRAQVALHCLRLHATCRQNIAMASAQKGELVSKPCYSVDT